MLDLYERGLQKWPHNGLPMANLSEIDAPWPCARAPVDGDLDMLCWHDQHNYLPGDILTKTDRASMAVSLETRLPMLDPEIAAFAWSLPAEARLGKAILKDALALHVPRALFERPKAGFTPPLEAWLLGPLKVWAADLLSPERLRRQGILDERRVTSFWRAFQTGGTLEEARLWSLLMLQAWLDARGK
jgi:asparagine synthase (glutamine-hydrolysing)